MPPTPIPTGWTVRAWPGCWRRRIDGATAAGGIPALWSAADRRARYRRGRGCAARRLADHRPCGPAFRTEPCPALRRQEAISCSSGTAALHLACLALELGPGDAAIVPSITFLATANAVRMTGAEVVFADVDPDNGLLTPATLQAAFDRAAAAGLKVKAVLPVHLAGQCADMTGLSRIARAQGAAIVEDACHAIGTYHACPDGSASAGRRLPPERHGDLLVSSGQDDRRGRRRRRHDQ
ncbi:MAG: aminotransferase class I/II-fold pyridoxal phosphate-dependent enzyme [Aliidongia sp.]